ncbi:uncharacterized protein PV07_11961 [Cladophialophora immunda]|uniref:Uncharacterized protein n=1 Tax=Cladophialophora immunda TaxID=569365 RepID=A0A0D2BXD0_9EURO|nr:uncharacterized protein PV07_11961 [Cladophialophora immunda]KIW23788.1 hypothetical protein PV07_11961 [Cladophialophora immunda]
MLPLCNSRALVAYRIDRCLNLHLAGWCPNPTPASRRLGGKFLGPEMCSLVVDQGGPISPVSRDPADLAMIRHGSLTLGQSSASPRIILPPCTGGEGNMECVAFLQATARTAKAFCPFAVYAFHQHGSSAPVQVRSLLQDK